MIRRTLICTALLLVAFAASAQVTNEQMLVPANWLAKNLESVNVIEIGDAIPFGSGHIPGARLVPYAQLVTTRNGIPNELPPAAQLEDLFTTAGIGDGRRIVLYSRDPLYATRAWFTLDYLGEGHRTAILNGGFTAWQKGAYPVTTEVNHANVVMYHANLNPGALATISTVKQVIALNEPLHQSVILIDARPPEQFFGDVAGADVTRPGHIPGAVNITVAQNYVPGTTPLLKNEADLRALYTNDGVTAKTTNIAYCRTGMQATVTYFVLRYLGYDARLYDGSYVEWSNAKDTNVADSAVTEVPKTAGR